MKKLITLMWITLGGLAFFGLTACQRISATAPPPDLTAATSEVQVVELPLEGEAAKKDAEYSGLAWYGDYLILLPQYPSRFGNNLWAIPKSEILAYLDGESAALHPQMVTLIDDGITDGIRGFEGYEAIAFNGATAYLSIESDAGAKMVCYVVRGQIQPDLSELALEVVSRQEFSYPIEIDNMCAEALTVVNGQVVTLYEANGANINPEPIAYMYEPDLMAVVTVPLPNIEYRITDATAPDAVDRFWAINYLYPGDAGKLDPADDAIAAQYGVGESHQSSDIVERLVEFEIGEDGIALTDKAPVWLQLADDARNWEGIVRLDERGFLIVTDKFPETILAFVPMP